MLLMSNKFDFNLLSKRFRHPLKKIDADIDITIFDTRDNRLRRLRHSVKQLQNIFFHFMKTLRLHRQTVQTFIPVFVV